MDDENITCKNIYEEKRDYFSKKKEKIDNYMELIEWSLYGAESQLPNNFYDDSFRDTFTSEIAETVCRYSGKENNSKSFEFYKAFFMLSVIYLHTGRFIADYKYSSFIKLSRTVFRGEDGDLVSTLDVMVEQMEDRLGEDFYQEYTKLYDLYKECYSCEFIDNIRNGIYQYLMEKEITYSQPELISYIERQMKNSSSNIVEYASYIKRNEEY